jgi:hypothetical protein
VTGFHGSGSFFETGGEAQGGTYRLLILVFWGAHGPRLEPTLSGVYSNFETARFIGTLPPKQVSSKIIPSVGP